MLSIQVKTWYCPHCNEVINFFPPDYLGRCSCGYNTEEDSGYDPIQEIEL